MCGFLVAPTMRWVAGVTRHEQCDQQQHKNEKWMPDGRSRHDLIQFLAGIFGRQDAWLGGDYLSRLIGAKVAHDDFFPFA